MNRSYSGLETRITELLRSYGQDLAVAKLQPNVQPWGTPEVLVAAVGIGAWLLKTAVRPVIEHFVRRKLLHKGQKTLPFEELQMRVEQVEKIAARLASRDQEMIGRLEEIRAGLSALFEEIEKYQDIEVKINDASRDELGTYLIQMGLSRRRAQRLAQEVLEVVQPYFLSNNENEREDYS